MRIDNEPASLLAEQLRAGLFLHHPYRNPNIGWEHEIRGLGTADAVAFYRKWYAPNNAMLIVAGDIGAAEVRALAERYFGADPCPAGAPAAAGRGAASPRRVAPRNEERAGGAAALEPLLSGAELPGRRNGSCLSVAGIGRNPRRRRQLAPLPDARARPWSGALGRCLLFAERDRSDELRPVCTPKPGVSVADLEAAIDAELRRLVRDGVEPGEVERAKQRMKAASVYASDSLSGPANIIGAALAIGQSWARWRLGPSGSARSPRRRSRLRRAPCSSSATPRPGFYYPSLPREAGMKRAVLALLALLWPPSAGAVTIERVTSPAGIEAWFVEDHTVPVVTIRFAFPGGPRSTPQARAGSRLWRPDCSTRAPGRTTPPHSRRSSKTLRSICGSKPAGTISAAACAA